MKEVARVVEGAQLKRGDNSVNGLPSVVMSVRKQPHTDTRHVTDEVVAALREMEDTLPADIVLYLDSIKPQIDIDGNGRADALTDGLMILRYLFGVRGPSLIGGAIGPGATRTTAAQIEQYIQSLLP